MLMLFLKILLAHIIGDFVLQTKSMVSRRKEYVGYLFLHIFIHAALLVLFLYPELPKYWMYIAFISCAHLGIDSMKIWFERKYPAKPVLYFCVDQFLHISVLLATTCYIYEINITDYTYLLTEKVLLYVLAFLLISTVSPIFLRLFFSKWNQEFEFQNKRKDSLLNAGLLIGIMERLLIVLFIQVNFLEGIGFLLAAKSIFRFGDLANAKDTKFTEYILVGTLASFLIAIAIGYALLYLIKFN